MVLDLIIGFIVLEILFIPIDKSIKRDIKKKIEKDKEYRTLASNGDDSFISGIMWADVGNDL